MNALTNAALVGARYIVPGELAWRRAAYVPCCHPERSPARFFLPALSAGAGRTEGSAFAFMCATTEKSK